MDINGEGIYETSFWKKSGEGPTVTEEEHFTDVLEHSFTSEDFRFTYKNGCIFASSMKWPEDGVARIRTFGKKSKNFKGVIRNVEVLGAPEGCEFQLCDEYLSVSAKGMKTTLPVGIKIMVD